MKQAFSRIVIRGLLPVLAFLVLGGPFAYVGFQTIHMQGERDEQGSVVLDFTREHFFGLVRVHRRIEGVREAGMFSVKDLVSRSSGEKRWGSSDGTTTGVYISGESSEVRLFAATSDLNKDVKLEAIAKINKFINDHDAVQFNETFSFSNVFGWIGLPLLLLGLVGIPLWVKAVIIYLVKGDLPSW